MRRRGKERGTLSLSSPHIESGAGKKSDRHRISQAFFADPSREPFGDGRPAIDDRANDGPSQTAALDICSLQVSGRGSQNGVDGEIPPPSSPTSPAATQSVLFRGVALLLRILQGEEDFSFSLCV